jgi:2-oxoglutarate dehydrogenase E1 component
MMREFQQSSSFFGANAPYIEDLYERYLADPASVPEAWRKHFDALPNVPGYAARDVAHTPIIEAFAALARQSPALRVGATGPPVDDKKQLKVLQFMRAHRVLGSRHSQLDPLKRMDKMPVPELELDYYGLTEADMNAEFSTGSWQGTIAGKADRAKLRDIVAAVKKTYCGTIGIEYMYISSTAEKRWLQKQFEGTLSTPHLSAEEKRFILERLTAAEGLEKYLHTRYVGQKRFSLEGGESLIPLVDDLILGAGAKGAKEVVLGMAHRGRLNILVNSLGKIPSDLFSEFEGKHHHTNLSSGDVKYHQGFSSDIQTRGGSVHLTLAFNPSHLEIVNPVVEGSVRARQQRREDHDGSQALAVLIHGDAAFAGQGVVMETLALSQTRGFKTGGTVHIVVNNQIGFTTSDTRDTRSSLYCTDIAKMIEAPVFHVNGDDAEAVMMVGRIALEYRAQFGKDVVIDMVCFRRLGHNEQDEPFVTQPLMYKRIVQHPGTRKLYADKLAAEGVIPGGHGEELATSYRAALDAGKSTNKNILYGIKPALAVDWAPYMGVDWRRAADTSVPLAKLRQYTKRLTELPDGFKVHPTVERLLAARRDMGDGKLPLDWGMAENLAYASLLAEGHPVRMSGQDSGRGTFAHRHAVLHDQNREKWDAGIYLPLQHIAPKQAKFLVIDSLLSEEAVLGFEYGYATAQPFELVIWEAQFGDFANGAQVVIDQFIASGEAKWGRLCSLTMFLPHGFEGQGPEHSSARLERYLQLCAEHNIQVVVPSTPAQMFHMLRRQIVRPLRKPLIVMMPKSLLRRKESTSSLDELVNGKFEVVIGDAGNGDTKLNAKKVKRMIFCSGKVYFDIVAERAKRGIDDIAVVRIEQLYPFPHEEFAEQIALYPNARSIVWAQEEPGNQGAWHRIQHYLLRHMRSEQTLGYALRPSSASPAVGYLSMHNEQQKELIEAALTWEQAAAKK